MERISVLNRSTVSREVRTVFMKPIKNVTKSNLKQTETIGYWQMLARGKVELQKVTSRRFYPLH